MVHDEVAQISGVRTYRAQGFADEAGLMCSAGYRASRADWFPGYGDLLILTLVRGATRPFHYHKEGTDTMAVLAGAMRVVLYDMREDSPTRGQVQEVELAADGRTVTFLRVPPLVAHAVEGLSDHAVAIDLASSEAQDGADFFLNAPNSVPYTLGRGGRTGGFATLAEENKAVVRRFALEVVNGGDVAAFEALVASDFVARSAPPGAPPTRDTLRGLIEDFRTAFPDLETTEEDMVAEGDTVVYRGTIRGTHRGEFIGIPPTGRRIEIGEVQVQRLAGGRLVEHWGQFDWLALLQQLGAMPAPGHA